MKMCMDFPTILGTCRCRPLPSCRPESPSKGATPPTIHPTTDRLPSGLYHLNEWRNGPRSICVEYVCDRAFLVVSEHRLAVPARWHPRRGLGARHLARQDFLGLDRVVRSGPHASTLYVLPGYRGSELPVAEYPG